MPSLLVIICLIIREKIRAIVELKKLLIFPFLPSFSHPVFDPDMLVQ